MKYFFIYMILFFSIPVLSQDSKICVAVPETGDQKPLRIKMFFSKKDTIISILFGSFTTESKKDASFFYFDISPLGKIVDSNFLKWNKIYTPEMIMDSLTKYRHDYERRNRSNFYVIIKGQGSIWYLHKAILTYIYSDPYSFHKNRNIDEMATTLKEFVSYRYRDRQCYGYEISLRNAIPAAASPNPNLNPYGDDCHAMGACDDKIILDSLQDYPCAKGVLDSVLKLNNEISDIIKKVFKDSTVGNKLVFTPRKLTGEDGRYEGSINTNVHPDLRVVEGAIYLSEDLLKYGSKEIILSTMLHEVLHAYLHLEQNRLTPNIFSQTYPSLSVYSEDVPENPLNNFYSYTTSSNHSEMATNYRSAIRDAVQAFNPNISYDVADALAVNGFFSPTSFPNGAATLQSYERDTRAINPITNKAGYQGTKCQLNPIK